MKNDKQINWHSAEVAVLVRAICKQQGEEWVKCDKHTSIAWCCWGDEMGLQRWRHVISLPSDGNNYGFPSESISDDIIAIILRDWAVEALGRACGHHGRLVVERGHDRRWFVFAYDTHGKTPFKGEGKTRDVALISAMYQIIDEDSLVLVRRELRIDD